MESLLEPLEEMWSCRHLEHGFLSSRMSEKNFFLFEGTKFVVICYGSPKKLMHCPHQERGNCPPVQLCLPVLVLQLLRSCGALRGHLSACGYHIPSSIPVTTTASFFLCWSEPIVSAGCTRRVTDSGHSCIQMQAPHVQRASPNPWTLVPAGRTGDRLDACPGNPYFQGEKLLIVTSNGERLGDAFAIFCRIIMWFLYI